MAANHAPSVWTPERVELLRAYYSQGLSCSMIAERMGRGITRNAVIGKLNRLSGVEARPSSVTKKPIRSANRGSYRKRKDFHFAGYTPSPAEGPAPLSSHSCQGVSAHLIPEPDASERRSLLSAGLFCKWLHDDGTACGHRVHKQSSWCPHHYSRVCVPSGGSRKALEIATRAKNDSREKRQKYRWPT
jgi:hypothetical protein